MSFLRIICLTTALLLLTTPQLVAGQAVARVAVELPQLKHALSQYDITALQGVFNKFDNINQADPDGMTLLHYAALEGLFPVVELLRSMGADTALADARGLLPVDYAEFGGHIETQQLLLGVEPATVDIFTAAAKNAQRALERLLAESDINARTADGKTVLHLSAQFGNYYATQRLIEAGADIFARDNDGNMPINLAIDAEHALVVSVLLEAVGINEKEHKGWTPLNWAILSGDRNRVRDLLAKGAKIGEGCQNAIEVCLLLEDRQMFDIVLAASGELGVDAASSRGDTALMGVSRRGDEQLVDTLLAHQANPNVADKKHGYTPLRLAAENNHLPIVKRLVEHGAHLNTVDVLGDSAVLRAALRGNVAVVEALRDAGADLNLAGAGGMTPLLWAIYWNEKATVKALLAGGANIRILNNAGISAVELAARRGDVEMVQLVMDHLDLDTHQTALQRTLKQAIDRNDDNLAMLETLYSRGGFDVVKPNLVHDNFVFNLRIQAINVLNAAQEGIDRVTKLKTTRKHRDFPLHWLVANAKLAALERALRHPFDLDAPNEDGITPVMQAIFSESPALETLLSHGADPNLSSGGFPPLVRAALVGNKESIKTLLAWRADIDAQDAEGYTALMRTATGGYFEATELLLLEGANPHLVNQDGDDALTLAERGGYQDIAEILRTAKGEGQ